MQKYNKHGKKTPRQRDFSKITNLRVAASNENEFDEMPDKEFQV